MGNQRSMSKENHGAIFGENFKNKIYSISDYNNSDVAVRIVCPS